MRDDKERVQKLCKLYGILPKQLLGQNFLFNEDILKDVIAAAGITPDDTVLEVGPGFGTLTSLLSQSAKRVIAIELDDTLFRVAQAQLHGFGNIRLVHQNILTADLVALGLADYKIVSNLPYGITSRFLRQFLTLLPKPKTMSLMLQLEVAERIVAEAGEMSILACAVQFYSRPSLVKKVSKDYFWPVPKVDSAIVAIQVLPQTVIDERIAQTGMSERDFFRLVRFGFSARRKQLHKNLSAGLSALTKKNISSDHIREVMASCKIHPQARAQDLALATWIELAKMIKTSVL